jgi:DNA-binding beta-propeller fold protein YncE
MEARQSTLGVPGTWNPGATQGDGGLATAAQLGWTFGVGVDPSGDILIADTALHRIRRIHAGVITTIAGAGSASFSGDGGDALVAEFNSPTGVAVAPDGSILVADNGNERVRKLWPPFVPVPSGGTGSSLPSPATAAPSP